MHEHRSVFFGDSCCPCYRLLTAKDGCIQVIINVANVMKAN